MDDLRRYITETFSPAFERLATRLGAAHPEAKFSVSSNDVGSATSYQGFNLYLQCFWPMREEEPDGVALMISLCHLTTIPRLNADVCWDGGEIEAEFDSASSNDKWPQATAECLERLTSQLPVLAKSLEVAVARGRPGKRDA